MSGGYFDYKQYQINDLVDEFNELKEQKRYIDYIDDVPRFESEIVTTLALLEEVAIRVHRIDWLLSGDDGEETFYDRLKQDLEEKGL